MFAALGARAEDASMAREHYQNGVALFDLGQYHNAAKEYEEAYKYKSDPALLFNIGQAYRNGNEPAEALRAYRSYLRRAPEAPNRREVEAHIERMQKLVDEQKVTAPPPQPEPSPPATATPPATTTLPSSPVVGTPPPAEKAPLYKRWWLWTAVGGVVVAGVVIGVAVAATTPKDAPAPAGAFGVTF